MTSKFTFIKKILIDLRKRYMPLCEEGEHFGIFGVGFGQRLRLGKLMRLTRVGDDHGYACAVDGFGGGDFETAGAFHHDEGDLVFFKVFDGMGDSFGVVGFGFGFRQRRNGDDEVSFGDVDACVIVLGTHHKPALHSVVLSGNCPVVSMGCPAAP